MPDVLTMQSSQERLDKIAPTPRFRQRTATQNAAEDRQPAGNSGYGGLIVLPDLFSAVNRDLIRISFLVRADEVFD
jgi:hypothetical protein